MKKILAFFFFGLSFSCACVCTPVITSAFTEYQTAVVSSNAMQTAALVKQNNEIDKSINLLDKENAFLEKLTQAEASLALKRANLIFELEKKIKLVK